VCDVAAAALKHNAAGLGEPSRACVAWRIAVSLI
jgi:hypothetical protein